MQKLLVTNHQLVKTSIKRKINLLNIFFQANVFLYLTFRKFSFDETAVLIKIITNGDNIRITMLKPKINKNKRNIMIFINKK